MSFERPPKRSSPFQPTAVLMTWGFVLTCLLLLAIIVGRYVKVRLELTAASRAQAAIWDVRAPACQPMTRADFAQRGYYAPQGISLWDTQIERRAGNGSCSLVSPRFWESGDFMSCRFNHPIFLRIVHDGRETYFRVGDGPATLRLNHDGSVRCVAGGAPS